MTIAIDFDGTLVEHKYPSIGKERPLAMQTLRQLLADGHRLILWTVRSGPLLDEAVQWCEKRGVTFYAINSNYPPGSLFENNANGSPKIVADIYVDDRNLGGLPEWGEIYALISEKRNERKKHRSGLRRWFHL